MANGGLRFAEFPGLTNGTIEVRVEKQVPGDADKGFVPAYECGIHLVEGGACVGRIGVRVGSTPFLVTYAGHLGYNIDPDHRGHRYAAQACMLIRPIALHHGLHTLWITVTPENIASRRTCEIIGCTLVEILDLPPDCDMYERGERQKCRYRWDLIGE